jgi:hypothetical protein
MTFLHLLNDISTIEFYLNSPRDEKKPGARTAAQELHDTVLTLKSVPADVTEELNKVASLFELQLSSTGTHSAQRISPAQGNSGAHFTATGPFLETQRTAAGAGDCRGAQISINDTVQ